MTLNVSLSAVSTFLSCEMQYAYRYLQKLRKSDEPLAPVRGRMFHKYLELYYKAQRKAQESGAVVEPYEVHKQALLRTVEAFREELEVILMAAAAAGDRELELSYTQLPVAFQALAERYYRQHGEQDWIDWEILLVEHHFDGIPLARGIRSYGVVDLVFRSRVTGRVSLVEHKTTENVPPMSYRLRDLQTLLYTAKLRWENKFRGGPIEKIDSILWNYIRTKDPTVPRILQRGEVSRDKRIDTNWETYAAVIRETGGDPDAEEFAEMHELLGPRESQVYFPRFEVVTVVAPQVLLSDFTQAAKDIKRKRRDWEKGRSKPVRHISRSCDYCNYLPLCQAAMIDGPDAEAYLANTKYRQEDSMRDKQQEAA